MKSSIFSLKKPKMTALLSPVSSSYFWRVAQEVLWSSSINSSRE
jgi:hypothetical protein